MKNNKKYAIILFLTIISLSSQNKIYSSFQPNRTRLLLKQRLSKDSLLYLNQVEDKFLDTFMQVLYLVDAFFDENGVVSTFIILDFIYRYLISEISSNLQSLINVEKMTKFGFNNYIGFVTSILEKMRDIPKDQACTIIYMLHQEYKSRLP